MPAAFLAGLSVEKRTASWRHALDAGRPRVALAFTDGGPIGWIAYGPTRDTDKDRTWGEIEAIYLHPAHCGQGVGAALVGHACRALHDSGHEWVSLWVLVKNHRARVFYEHEGFVAEDDVKTFEIDGAPIEEVRYWRALPSDRHRLADSHRNHRYSRAPISLRKSSSSCRLFSQYTITNSLPASRTAA